MRTNTIQRKKSDRPLLRWAGGKHSMVEDLKELLPSEWGRYFEPMVGGAALFFNLRPKKAILGDINGELINFYSILKKNPGELAGRLLSLKASKRKYYQIRKSKPKGSIQRAVRFAYLNRLCWNGLYRVNRQGQFNVPIGDRFPKELFRRDQIMNASVALKTASFRASGFEKTLRFAKRGDFVFLDPPYPRGSQDKVGFNRYSSTFFTSSHHATLADEIRRLDKRGVKIMLVISGVNAVKNVYPTTFNKTILKSKSLISCNGKGRRMVREVVMTNY